MRLYEVHGTLCDNCATADMIRTTGMASQNVCKRCGKAREPLANFRLRLNKAQYEKLTGLAKARGMALQDYVLTTLGFPGYDRKKREGRKMVAAKSMSLRMRQHEMDQLVESLIESGFPTMAMYMRVRLGIDCV